MRLQHQYTPNSAHTDLQGSNHLYLRRKSKFFQCTVITALFAATVLLGNATAEEANTLPATNTAQTQATNNIPLTPTASTSQVSSAPSIEAKSFILMDALSGQVLAEGNADERLNPASLTKIMTSYVIGNYILAGKISNDEMVTISKNAWATGNPELKGSSLMFLKPNERVSVLDLNKGLVIQSGNDAAIALAEHVAGSESAFVDLMNGYVQKIGMNNTHFKTVHGLDAEGQFSSARDMALLSKALIKELPDEYALNRVKEFTWDGITQPNRNRLLWSDTLNVDGLKTGHTSSAGYNLVSSAIDNEGMRLIAVVFGTESDKKRFAEAEKLLSWGFRTYTTKNMLPANQKVLTKPVWYGQENEVELGLAEDAILTIPKGQERGLVATFELNNPNLEAPLAQNQAVGKVIFALNGQVISQKDLVVLKSVEQGGFFSRLWDFIVLTVTSWFS